MLASLKKSVVSVVHQITSANMHCVKPSHTFSESLKINVPLCFLSTRISGIPKLGMLREGLKLFISHFLLKNAQSQGPAEQAALLSERAQVATRAMEAREAKLKL